MPAYSFQGQFVPYVKEGSKTQTIRKKRKYQAKAGDTVYLYFAMRTKWCKKIGEGKCTGTDDINISLSGSIRINGKLLTREQCDMLAWNDGFRPEGTSIGQYAGSHALMIRWWRQTHELPFRGDIIYWNPTHVKIKP